MAPVALLRVIAVALLLCACSETGGGVTEPPPAAPVSPSIAAQPQDASADIGGSATFTVSASGSLPLTYQWHRNGAPIAGATTPSLVIAPVAEADQGALFTVTVTNSGGSTQSRAARLSVRIPPAILSNPSAINVASAVPAVMSVGTRGTELVFQWRRNGTPIPGAIDSIYVAGMPLAGDDGASYTVTVSNSLGSVTSEAARLSVNSGAGLRPTSYANAKGPNTAPAAIPNFGHARAFGDFAGAGARDYFVATLAYDVTRPQAEASPGSFQFWRSTPAGYVADPQRIDDPTGCVHPRKAAVADFNNDNRPDIFVACHGYDAAPFPGEHNRIVLSQPDGSYSNRVVAGTAGFFHSVTAFDVNNDGRIDAVVANNRGTIALQVLVNDGQGAFTFRPDLSPVRQGNYFTVEAADVDGDGRYDLLAGGHEWEDAPTVILVNGGTGSFANSVVRQLPAVPGHGVVLDFVVMDANRDGVNEVYTLRTSGGGATFYVGATIQRVSWPDLSASTILSNSEAPWIDFAVPFFSGAQYRLRSDTDRFDLDFAL